MKRGTKQIVVLCLSLTLVALVLLSMSLSHMELQKGLPFPGSAHAGTSPRTSTPVTATGGSPLPLLVVMMGVLLIGLLIYVPARLVRLANMRRLAVLILGIIVLLVVLNLLPRIVPGAPSLQAEEAPAGATSVPREYSVTPLGEAPPIFISLAAACVLLGIGLLAARVLQQSSKRSEATDGVLKAAEQALADLNGGNELSNVIVRCYMEMSEALRAERNIERQQTMTAREFEDWLADKGLPKKPVQQLTMLFERARYSNEAMSTNDEASARGCLGQIVQDLRAGSR